MTSLTDKTIDTIPEDVYALFDQSVHHEVNDANIEEFGETVKQLMRNALAERKPVDSPLRFSALGKPDRQLWYAANLDAKETFSGKTILKFTYGHLIEAMLLFLVKEAGHVVEREQEEIEVDGVKGHIDAIIDGVTVDVKSASPMSYAKFERGTLYDSDPFGYISQISGYSNALTPDEGGAFLAFDKVAGSICVMRVGQSITSRFNVAERIKHLKEVIASDKKPSRCYPDEEDGKAGNRKLGTQCSYCAFKETCWADANEGQGLRTFLYSGRPRFLTQTVRVPDVYEVPNDKY